MRVERPPGCGVRVGIMGSDSNGSNAGPGPGPGAPRPSLMDSPDVVRFVPFAAFVLVGVLGAKAFAGSEYWMYAAKTLVAGALLWWFRGKISEMRWVFSVEGVVVGLAIAALWMGLEGRVPSLGRLWDLAREWSGGPKAPEVKPPEAWNPVAYFAPNAALGWALVVVRVVGRSLVVPAMEEVFYRSLVYRYLVDARFEGVSLGTFRAGAFAGVSLLFGLMHPDHWLPAVLCGAAYQALVVRKGRLGDAMLAHGVTNLAISVRAIASGRWEFS